ncbi:MAG: hypothetical protein KAW90_04740 [Dehalococcoidales bacterium]|nr:hypothetical protein [Dehalococcoidales bacterium]
MAEKKNAKYVVDYDKPFGELPAHRLKMDPKFIKRIVHVGPDTVPDAEFYSEAKWILPGSKEEIREVESHTHSFGELIGCFGFNYDDIQDLGAEIEFTVDNKTYKITKSFASFVPAGVQHGPLIIRNVKRPIFHFIAATTPKYE